MTSTSYQVGGDAQGRPTDRVCRHSGSATATLPDQATSCEDCLAEGTTWVHLRTCLSCGHTGCCDSSPRRHARAHWQATSHPLIRSAQPGEDWAWCYADELVLVPLAPDPEA